MAAPTASEISLSDGVVIPTDMGILSTYSPGDVAFVLLSSALVLLMSPAVGFMYSGLLRRPSALSQLALSVAVLSIVSVQWICFGYSVSFGGGGPFIGNLSRAGMFGSMQLPSPTSQSIPELVFALFQMMFATMTAVLVTGATAERGRLAPALIFAVLWTTFVYDILAHWIWSPAGWSYQLGAYDFAGGGPVHQASGAAALAYSIYLGRRKGWGTERLAFRPNNIANIVMGTSLLWFGWTGFNAGSELAGNLRAVQAAFNTNGAAASGGITWMLMDWRYDRQFSTVSLCSGVLAGLIAVTPAAGFVCTMAAIAIGVVASVCCNMATRLKFVFKYDDALDIFSTHGIGGLVGTILTGVFADADIIAYDGTVSKGGWVNQHWMQVPYQLADAAATLAWSFTITLLLCFIIDHIPGCKLRVRDEVEEYGVDEEQLGEVMYSLVPTFSAAPPLPQRPHSPPAVEKPASVSSMDGDTPHVSPISVALDAARSVRWKERVELGS